LQFFRSKLFKFIWKAVLYLVLITVSVTMIMPFYWMIRSSFSQVQDILKYPPKFWLRNPTIEGYQDLFKLVPFGRYMFNSIFISAAVTLCNLFFCSLAGYAFSKHKFPFQDFIFTCLLASMMVPWQVNLIPGYLIAKKMGWLDTYWGLIVPYIAGVFGVFLMRQLIRSIPNDLIDAAKIDGCGEFRIYRLIILPEIRPAIATLGIFEFLHMWNMFVWPLIIIVNKTELRTMPLALAVMNAEAYGRRIIPLMAGAVLATMPMVLLFLMFQRMFIKGIAFTGMKE
jgi:multiple sugar transport system permease protein